MKERFGDLRRRDRPTNNIRDAGSHQNIRADFPGLAVTDTEGAFCDAQRCAASREGKLLCATRDHLTPIGSRYLVGRIAPQLALE